MFHFVKNKKQITACKFIAILFLLCSNLIYAKGAYIRYELRFIKLLEYNKRELFIPKNVKNIINNDIDIKTDENTNKKYIEVTKKDIGKKIKLKLTNEEKKDWIIISPTNGEFVVPEMPFKKGKYIKIDVKLVHKFTELYFDIFGKYIYSIQVFYTKNKDIALQKINDLKRDYNDTFYEAVPIIPHRGYMYKVKVGHYHDLEKAKKKKEEIIYRYLSFKDSFITARLQDK